MFTFSKWAATPIDLSDDLFNESWASAFDAQMPIPGGYLWAKNDAQYLYIALDMIDDPYNDPGTGDYFWFTFDTDRNGAISPNKDVNYGLFPGNPNKLGKQFYLGPGSWTGISHDESKASCRVDFGASPNSEADHRIWKMRFRLSEIEVSLSPTSWFSYTRFGLRVHSATPSQTHDSPANFTTNFSALHFLIFSRKPTISSSLLGPVIGSVGLIPTTKIDTSGRASTDPGYYLVVRNAAFGRTINLIANGTQLAALWAANARKYKVLHRSGTTGSFQSLESGWKNYRWNGSDYVLQSFSMHAGFYYLVNPAVDYSIDDLLMGLDTRSLSTGLHQFKVEFYTAANVPVAAPPQVLTLFIDNNVPEVSVNSIKHGTAEIGACGIVTMANATDGLVFDYSAFDTEGNLRKYALRALWGDNKSAAIDSKTYDESVMGSSWVGQHNIVAPGSGVWVPPDQCAYTFEAWVHARTTNGYGWVGSNRAHKSITVMK